MGALGLGFVEKELMNAILNARESIANYAL